MSSKAAEAIALMRASGGRVVKGVPIPAPCRQGSRTGFARAFRSMAPGDCILCTTTEAVNARKMARGMKWKLAQRTEGDGVRTWRVS